MHRHGLLLLLLCPSLTVAVACGDSSAAPATLDPVPMSLSISIPRSSAEDATFAALEYRVSCDGEPAADPPLQRATFYGRGFYFVDPQIPADLWNASLELTPGDCLITFYGLADNDERHCAGSEAFTVTEDTRRLFLEAPCLEPAPS